MKKKLIELRKVLEIDQYKRRIPKDKATDFVNREYDLCRTDNFEFTKMYHRNRFKAELARLIFIDLLILNCK